MHDNWKQIKEIFTQTLSEDAANRSFFISQQCSGDKYLESEVKSLLDAYVSAETFMENPAVAEVADTFGTKVKELKVGEFLGHYRILRKIGKGGMGEVYLAQDTRLGRNVAVKILGDYFGNNQVNLKRFINEAQTASSLNHPNIVVIHEIDEKDGYNFIVSEFIEGLTLSELIKRKKISASQICDIAIQIAKALAAAHNIGVIHRDIKPDNVMMREDGIVKVLDFGLAKLVPEESQSDYLFSENSFERTNTNSGMILGTIAYMSPEQTRGKPVDARTDVWSFGVLLYQLLTRKLPFHGDTTTDLMVSILTAEPEPLTSCAPDVPKTFEKIVHRALMKNPDARFQHISEILNELKIFRRELTYEGKTEPLDFLISEGFAANKDTEPNFTQITANEGEKSNSGQKHSFVGAASVIAQRAAPLPLFALLGCGILITLGYFGWSKLIAPATQVNSFQKMRLSKLTFEGLPTDWTTVSPDGKYIAYVLQGEKSPSLMIRQTATSAIVELVPPTETSYLGLRFSPDSNFIYYTTQKRNTPGELFAIPVLGSSPRKILDNVTNAITFSPDGKQIAFVSEFRTVMIADVTGESVRVLAEPKPFEFRTYLDWSPDGKTIIGSIYSNSDNKTYISEFSVADGTEKRLPTPPWLRINSLRWLADGSGLIMTGRDADTKFSQIWEVSYPSGELRRITNDFSTYLATSLPNDNKSIFTVKSERLFNLWIASGESFQNTKKITTNEGRDEGMSGVQWLPDGKILYSVRTTINLELWVIDADGSNDHSIVNQGSSFYPTVSPDGKYIVYVSDRSGNLNLWRTDIDGRNSVQLTDFPDTESNPSFTPDGKSLLYDRRSSDDKLSIWKLNLQDGSNTQLIGHHSYFPVVSPDGKFFFCKYGPENSETAWKLAIVPIEGGKPIKILDLPKVVKSGIRRWATDGKSILYLEKNNQAYNVWSQPIDLSSPKQLTFFDSGEIGNFDLSPDGKTFVFGRGNETSDVVKISDFR